MIRVISLPNDNRRGTFSRNYINFSGQRWSFFDAFDKLAAPLIYNESETLISKGRPLTDSELGCYSSHFNLWSEFVLSDCSHLVALEDDIVLDWSLLDALFEEPGFYEIPGIVRLFSRAPLKFRHVSTMCDRYVLRCTSYASGTQAYVISKSIARQLLSKSLIIRHPIDDTIDRSWAHGIKNFAIFPYPVIECRYPSRIGEHREPSRELTFLQLMRRYFYIICDTTLRFAYNLRADAARLPKKLFESKILF